MSSRYQRRADVIETELPDELILLDPRSQEMFSLNATGCLLWQSIDGNDESALVRRLVQYYDTSEEEAAADVRRIIADLLEWQLIRELGG